MRFAPLLIAALAAFPVSVSAASAPPVAVRDTTRLGTSWTRWTVKDGFGRTITFYISDLPDSLKSETRPVALVIEGSGAQSVWVKVGDRIGGSLQNLMRRAAKHRVRVVVVEKPGVAFLEQRERAGGAEGSSEEFRREHTLERWAEANAAALRAVVAMPGIAPAPVLVTGHSEGADVACRVAALEPRVTHVAPLAGAGTSQLFDMIALQLESRPGDAPGDAAKRRDAVLEQWKAIQADPQSTDKFWFGHPYRRWSTFLASNRLEDLMKTRARVFIAHGTADTSVPVAGADWLFAELLARGRDVHFERWEGADHGFRKPGDPTDPQAVVGLEVVLGQVLSWALTPAGTPAR